MRGRTGSSIRPLGAAAVLGSTVAVLAAPGPAARVRTLEVVAAEGVAAVVTQREDPEYVVSRYETTVADVTDVLHNAGPSISEDVTVTSGPGSYATIDATCGSEGLGPSPFATVRLVSGARRVRMARIFSCGFRTSAHAPPGGTVLLASFPHPVRRGAEVGVTAATREAAPGFWMTTSDWLTGRDDGAPSIRVTVRDGAAAEVSVACAHTHVAGADLVGDLVVPRLGAAVAQTTFELTPRVDPDDRGLIDLEIRARGTQEFRFVRGSVDTPAGRQRTLTPETADGESVLDLADVPDGGTVLAGSVRAVLTPDGMPREWTVIASPRVVVPEEDGAPLLVDVRLDLVRPE